MIELRALGGVDLRGPDGSELRGILSGPKRLAVLAYLAIEKSRGFHRRDTLLGLFWPELDQDHARASLRNLVHVLRRSLGDGVILGRGDEELCVDGLRLWCDATAFGEMLNAGKPAEALSLYRGELLQGLYLSGTPEFEHWLEAERTRLRGKAAEAAWILVGEQESQGSPAGAVQWARRAIAFSPYDEDGLRRTLGMLERLGEHAGAIALYEEFARRLAKDLEMEPSPDTRTLVDRLRVSPKPGAPWDPDAKARSRQPSQQASRLPLGKKTAVASDPLSAGDRNGSLAVAGVGDPGANDSQALPGEPDVAGLGAGEPRRLGGPPRRRFGLRLLTFVGALATLVAAAVLYVGSDGRGRGFSASGETSAEGLSGIAVLPFQVSGVGLESWREGLVDLLSINLENMAGLRAIDSRTVLARWNTRSEGKDLRDLATTLETARDVGARYALVGSAVSMRAQVRLAAQIYDVESGRDLGQLQVDGPPDSIMSLVDRLSVQLLGLLSKSDLRALPPVRLASTMTPSLPALRAYLEGESYFRRSDWEHAIPAYQRALEADSSFALALYRLSFAFGWAETDRSDLPRQYSERAERLIGRLPEREALIIRSKLLRDRGDPKAIDVAREAVRKYPDNAEAWYALGENSYHMGFQVEDREESERAFSKAIALDPGFAPAYSHLINFAFDRADSARAATLITVAERLSLGAELDVGRLAFVLGFGDSLTRAAEQSVLDTLSPQALAITTPYLQHPRFASAEEQVWRAIQRQPDAEWKAEAANSLLWNHLNRGRLREALDDLDDPMLSRGQRRVGTFAMYEMRMPIDTLLIDGELSLAVADTSRPYEYVYFAAYAADRGRWSDHLVAVSRLRKVSQNSFAAGDSANGLLFRRLAAALDGYGLWKRGRREEALPLMMGARSQDAVVSWLWRILLEMGRPLEAIRYLENVPQGVYNAFWLGKAYEQAGEAEKAQQAYKYFAKYWKDADPALQPMVRQGRAAAERVAHPTRGG